MNINILLNVVSCACSLNKISHLAFSFLEKSHKKIKKIKTNKP